MDRTDANVAAPRGETSYELRPRMIHAKMGVPTFARTILANQAVDFFRLEPKVRQFEDPEVVHDARVALRRFRGALRTFDEDLPEALKSLDEPLRWLAGVFGEVRDLDVMLGTLKQRAEDENADPSGLAGLRGLLTEELRSAQERLRDALDSSRYTVLSAAMTVVLQEKTLGGGSSVRAAGRKLIVREHKRDVRAALELGEHSPSTEFHHVRKRLKRFRYTIEFFEPLIGKAAAEYVAQLKEVQDLLGERQDATVAVERLRGIIRRPNSALRAKKEAERWISELEERDQHLRAGFIAQAHLLKGKQWQRLKDAL